jgi:hypothetical protein
MSVHEPARITGAPTYALGHADAEVRRLRLQADLYDPYTGQALRLAGLRVDAGARWSERPHTYVLGG